MPAERLEKRIEAAIKRRLEALFHCRVVKFGTQFDRSWPDRIVLGSSGQVGFLEVKRPGGTPTRLQHERIMWLREMGHRAAVVISEGEAIFALDSWGFERK